MTQAFNMDCMDAMAQMKDNQFELCICDPPYGNNWDAINKIDSKTNSAKRTTQKVTWDNAPDLKYFTELKRVSKNQIIWGANFFGLKGGYICWNKFGTAFGEAELAYCSMINSVRVFEYRWNGMLQADMKNKETRIHPTQKPVALYKWLLKNYAKEGDTILDSHLGSGSSRIACHDMGFDFTGYEIDKDYFDAQEKRFNNHIRQQSLFKPNEMY